MSERVPSVLVFYIVITCVHTYGTPGTRCSAGGRPSPLPSVSCFSSAVLCHGAASPPTVGPRWRGVALWGAVRLGEEEGVISSRRRRRRVGVARAGATRRRRGTQLETVGARRLTPSRRGSSRPRRSRRSPCAASCAGPGSARSCSGRCSAGTSSRAAGSEPPPGWGEGEGEGES